MNKNARVVQQYSLKEILQAVLMFLFTGAFPIAVIIVASVNIVLLFMTSFYTVITIMGLLISTMIFIASYMYIKTLKEIRICNDMDYRKIYLQLAIPLSLLAMFLSYYISAQFY